MPIVLAGVSGMAVKVAACHADRFVLPAVTIDEARQTIARVRAAASCHGRAQAIRFALPVQPVAPRPAGLPANKPASHAEATVLSGSPEKIALTLLDYCEIGVTDFVIAGLNTPGEVAAFGERVVALVRRTLAHREGNADEHRARPANVVRGRWRAATRLELTGEAERGQRSLRRAERAQHTLDVGVAGEFASIRCRDSRGHLV